MYIHSVWVVGGRVGEDVDGVVCGIVGVSVGGIGGAAGGGVAGGGGDVEVEVGEVSDGKAEKFLGGVISGGIRWTCVSE